MRFLFIDDHALFRFGLRALLAGLPGAHEFFEAESCEAALQLDADTVDPDLVVLDLTLPGMNGMEGMQRLRQWCPTTPIVLMSAVETPEWVLEGLRRGAQGFIPKTSSAETVLAAINKILEGGVHVPPLGTADDDMAASDEAALTPRQREVLDLLIHNRSNKEIGTALGMRVNTVRVHVAAILRALHVDNRVDAARAAISRGLIHGG